MGPPPLTSGCQWALPRVLNGLPLGLSMDLTWGPFRSLAANKQDFKNLLVHQQEIASTISHLVPKPPKVSRVLSVSYQNLAKHNLQLCQAVQKCAWAHTELMLSNENMGGPYRVHIEIQMSSVWKSQGCIYGGPCGAPYGEIIVLCSLLRCHRWMAFDYLRSV